MFSITRLWSRGNTSRAPSSAATPALDTTDKDRRAMGACRYCGRDAGLFRRRHKERRARHDTAAAKLPEFFIKIRATLALDVKSELALFVHTFPCARHGRLRNIHFRNGCGADTNSTLGCITSAAEKCQGGVFSAEVGGILDTCQFFDVIQCADRRLGEASARTR